MTEDRNVRVTDDEVAEMVAGSLRSVEATIGDAASIAVLSLGWTIEDNPEVVIRIAEMIERGHVRIVDKIRRRRRCIAIDHVGRRCECQAASGSDRCRAHRPEEDA